MKDGNYKQQLKNITTVILDFDGVLTDGTVFLMPPTEFVRTMNVRDSFAIQFAVKNGVRIAVITGGNNIVVKERMAYLGVNDVFLQAHDKLIVYEAYKKTNGLKDSEILYMGDDMPDFAVMKKAGIAIAPNDAVEEIKSVSTYVSPFKGGHGCVRDVLEQMLKIKGLWDF
jgi:3-deoxy-D-manno-octulosonate 8-phosphate phosphatase (KDO 8-P phosphatase)